MNTSGLSNMELAMIQESKTEQIIEYLYFLNFTKHELVEVFLNLRLRAHVHT